MVTTAVASEPPDPSIGVPFSARPATSMGSELTSRLGTSRTAGNWVDSAGRPVVAVTDDEAAAEVRRAGARPKMVRHSMSDLKSATASLRSAPRVAGTSWSLDYKNNQVVVRGDSTVSAADWSRMTEVAKGIGGFVRMERTEGTFTTRLNGAEPILSTAGRCSAGFNVTDGKTDYILTAGHCGPDGSVWFADDRGRQQVGTSLRGSFPGDDYSLVKYDSGRAGKGAEVVSINDREGVRITGVADPEVGQKVFRSGSTTGLREGEVTALNATVNYPEGTVTGLIETSVCAEPGDSGGPMFADGIALGVTSGGSGDCTAGGTTFFQPVTKALTELNVKLIVSKQAGGAAPAPSASQGTASPGSSAPVTGGEVSSLLTRLTDPRNVGPGLLVIAGSLLALVATRWIRSEQERKAYRQYYSATWG
ncbi:protease [Streptomyces djakartensis]|uniref:Protease n=2 Tax=Streptomyces djakartensis TaxID=68193 RepID=A0ABQ3AFW1_9ACTN|nr:protease [Streptomyces djakartensis]